jgi:hypothetical protein
MANAFLQMHQSTWHVYRRRRRRRHHHHLAAKDLGHFLTVPVSFVQKIFGGRRWFLNPAGL